MRISDAALSRRFEEAARVLAVLRRCTLEMREAGDRLLAEREARRVRGPRRSRRGGAPRG